MTSDEIREARAAEHSTNTWLKEIALQLALLNEKQPIPEPVVVSRPFPRRKVQ